MACATDIKYTKPKIIHDNMYITLMLNFSWTWRGKMLAHPIYWRKVCAGQAVHCLFYSSGKYVYKKNWQLTKLSQHTPGFNAPYFLRKHRYKWYVIMLCWLPKNDRTYAGIVHVKYFELITVCMKMKKAFLCNKYYVTLWTFFARRVHTHTHTHTIQGLYILPNCTLCYT